MVKFFNWRFDGAKDKGYFTVDSVDGDDVIISSYRTVAKINLKTGKGWLNLDSNNDWESGQKTVFDPILIDTIKEHKKTMNKKGEIYFG